MVNEMEEERADWEASGKTQEAQLPSDTYNQLHLNWLLMLLDGEDQTGE